MPLISFSWLSDVKGLEKLCWTVKKGDILILCLISEERLSDFCCLDFFFLNKTIPRHSPFIPIITENFYHTNNVNLVKNVLCVTWNDVSFLLLKRYITLISLHVSNHLCIPEMNPLWSRCMIKICIIHCWICFTKMLLLFQFKTSSK